MTNIFVSQTFVRHSAFVQICANGTSTAHTIGNRKCFVITIFFADSNTIFVQVLSVNHLKNAREVFNLYTP